MVKPIETLPDGNIIDGNRICNYSAERNVLRAIIQTPEINLAELGLSPNFFDNPIYNKIYKAIVNIKNDGAIPDVVKLADYFSRSKQSGNPTINDIASLVVDANGYTESITLKQNIALLSDLAKRRDFKKFCLSSLSYADDISLNIDDAIQRYEEERDRIKIDTDYKELLTLPTMESLEERDKEILKGRKGDIKINYYFHLGKDVEQLTLPTEAITMVCGLTSHGKSTFMRNLALQVVQGNQGNKGDTLFYTYESSEQEVEWGFINTYIGKAFNKGVYNNNFQMIKDYEQSGGKIKRFFPGNDPSIYTNGKAEFRKNFLCEDGNNSGKLRLLRRSDDASKLIEEIRYYNKKRPVKCIFLDYIQKLHLPNNKLPRTEELAKICSSFEDLANELHIPIVMGAQLNRQTTDPVTMCSQNLAQSTSIEQSSGKMIFLWNSSERARVDKTSEELNEWANRTGITLGDRTEHYLYARLEKNRLGIRQAEAVLNFDGNTGLIKQEKDSEKEIIRAWKEKMDQTEQNSIPSPVSLNNDENNEETDDAPF